MTDQPNPLSDRDDLVARLNLMEAMISEGRKATGRHGWIFVLWGLVDLAGMALEYTHPGRMWNWPLAIGLGAVLQFAGFALRRRAGECLPSTKGRALSAIWSMMGVSLSLYCFTGIFTHTAGGATYIAAIFIIIGMAHAASALILRWGVQGAVAVLWWVGGVACYLVSGDWFVILFCVEMLFGMVFFGLYAMLLERRTPPPAAAHA